MVCEMGSDCPAVVLKDCARGIAVALDAIMPPPEAKRFSHIVLVFLAVLSVSILKKKSTHYTLSTVVSTCTE